MELNVSHIQHFSVGDGAGLRTTVFLKGCNLRCPWCHNPETWSSETQILRYEQIGKEVISGKKLRIEEIVEDVLTDKDFYESSGGGVTISGGEAMLQAAGVAELSKQLCQNGISVLIDTAGNVPYTAFELTNPYVDGYLFDYKTDEAEKYSRLGGDRHLIRDNIRALLRDEKNVRIRIPLIPNFNTSDAAIHSMCESLRELGVKTVDLIPFHRMGSGKYKALGLSYPYQDISLLAKEQLQKIRNTFSDYFETNLEI